MIETQKYVRKPLYVEAVRITHNNFDEIATWCQGEVLQDEAAASGARKKYVKVRVHNPKNARQTMAFVGDWLLYTERGYKVYTNKAFQSAFDKTPEPIMIGGEEIAPGTTVNDAVEQLRQATENAVLSEITPDTPIEVGPMAGYSTTADSPEMTQARETIEADGGSVEEATPEAIAEVVNDQQPTVPAMVDGKRVLSREEQEAMGSDQIRELIQSGEYVLAQDLAA